MPAAARITILSQKGKKKDKLKDNIDKKNT
jgi:hypothetical protein